jgi:glycosyltransferase involved in cell wall biosynthesis
MMLILYTVTLIYLIIILSFIIGFDRIEIFKPTSAKAETKFSIVIPFRNEALKLPQLLSSILNLDYSRTMFEVLLINDYSDDNSVEIIESYLANTSINYTIIENKVEGDSPKKEAIKLAIELAKNKWIITTDADCILSKKWLSIFDQFIQEKKPEMVIAPVTYTASNAFFDGFQLLDFLSLQSVTIGAFGINNPFICNGANFAYQKELFLDLNGFKENDNLASGDDVFLLQKAVHQHKKVNYLKSIHALVKTNPQSTFSELVQQRIRWASKSKAYKNLFSKLVGLVVLFMNLVLVVALFLSFTSLISTRDVLIAFAIKITIDLWCILKVSNLYGQNKYLYYLLPSSLIYPFFIIYISILSIFSGFIWKERRYKS